MPSIFDNNPALKNRMGQTNMAIASAMKSGTGAAVEAIVRIDESKIDDMPGNEYVFGYDDNQIQSLVEEIKATGFRGAIEVIPSKDLAGRYTCVSGHQRLRALRIVGEKNVPCQVLKGLSDDQVSAYWMSANVIHRDLSPLTFARLVSQLYSEYENSKKRPEGKIKGGKVAFAAGRLHIGESQVKRYYALTQFPDVIQQFCAVKDFPYTVLLEAREFSKEELDKLSAALNAHKRKHPEEVISAEDLRKLLKKIESDRTKPAYADIDPLEPYENHTGEGGREAKEFEKKQKDEIEKHYKEIEEKSSDRKPKVIDSDLIQNVDSLYGLVSGSYTVGNRALANQAIVGLKKVIKKLENQEY